MCEAHFVEADFKTPKKRYLKDTCFPIPFQNSDASNEFPLKVLTPTKTYSRKKSLPIIDADESMEEIDFNQLPTPTYTSNQATPNQNKTNVEKQFNFKNDFTIPDTPKKRQLKKQITFQSCKLASYRKKISRLNREIKKQRDLKCNLPSLLVTAMACLSVAAKTFVGMQLRVKRRTFTDDEKDFSISFYYKSPSAYRFLRQQGILLPSVSSIRSWIGECIFKTGIDDTVLDQLQKKYNTMSKEERKCILAFDEMVIKKIWNIPRN